MRKKDAGALFMDLHVSPDDRVGATPKKKARTTKPTARKPAKKGGRVEPGFAGKAFVADDEPAVRVRRGDKTGRTEKPKKAKSRRREKKPLTFWRLIGKLFYWLCVLAVWGAIAAAGIVVYYAAQLPSANTWTVPDRPANIRIVAANGQLIANRGKMGGEAVELRDLPYYVPAAFISIEDKRFYDHFGIDILGLGAVALESIKAGHVTRGASTLTQQLAKNLFLTPDQTLGRKVQEALLALWLEHNYTKDDILELYLNRVDFGHQKIGIEAAAQFYFGHSAANLSLAEAAILAGSVKAPSRLNPKGDAEQVAARQKLVLQAMADQGYITQAEAQKATIDPTQTIRTKVAGSESYVADWVETLMKSYLGDVKQDVIVYTTLDWDVQKEAEFAVKEAVRKYGDKNNFSQAALVSMDVDGNVRALIGGVDYSRSQYDRAVTARRQPGSAFKPFVYLAAMEKGYTPDTMADDSPFDYQGWSPGNSDDKFMGPITLRNALAYSRNTVAARIAIDVGPDKVVEAATRMGISSPLQPVPSIALGTQEVSLLELTAAYVPFANGGNGVIANIITRIESADGKVLYQSSPAGPGRVIQPNVVAEMNDMMHTAVEIGTGKAAQLNGWPMAGKTGTSQKSRDAVFVGYTARMVTGVWLGNDDDKPTTLYGGTVPVEIWSDVMAKAHEGIPVAELPGAYTTDQTQQAQDGTRPAIGAEPAKPKKTLMDLLGEIFGGGG